MSDGRLRLGTRGSALALAQARTVAAALGGAELVPVTTTGDRESRAGPAVRGAEGGDKSRWVRELEGALLAGAIDIAVHSAKDVPGDLPEGLVIAGVPARADARDGLCGASSLASLPPGARIGTSSIRRRAQLRALREDLDVIDLRGNVDTRLRRLAEDGYDAIVLAVAGLERLGRTDALGAPLDVAIVVPAPGQGALALEVRAGDARVAAAAARVTDPGTAACLAAERALVRALSATCHTPVGAHAVLGGTGSSLELTAFAGMPDGSRWVRDAIGGPSAEPEALGARCGERLLSAGAAEILRDAEDLALAAADGSGAPP